MTTDSIWSQSGVSYILKNKLLKWLPKRKEKAEGATASADRWVWVGFAGRWG